MIDEKLMELAKEVQTKLPEGATLMHIKRSNRSETDPMIIIVAKWDHGNGNVEFVTWALGAGNHPIWGHYFGDLLDAARDFAVRCGGRV